MESPSLVKSPEMALINQRRIMRALDAKEAAEVTWERWESRCNAAQRLRSWISSKVGLGVGYLMGLADFAFPTYLAVEHVLGVDAGSAAKFVFDSIKFWGQNA